MKYLQLLLVFSFVFLVACEKDDKNLSLQDFSSVIPNGWVCEIIESNFELNDIPKNAENPIAIIKYRNINREFIKYVDTKVNPSLTLNLYPINQKKELIDFIKSQQIFSWCIPIYYGETNNYFIITSPCFINNGTFTNEADSSINDLHESLKTILTVKEYDLIDN